MASRKPKTTKSITATAIRAKLERPAPTQPGVTCSSRLVRRGPCLPATRTSLLTSAILRDWTSFFDYSSEFIGARARLRLRRPHPGHGRAGLQLLAGAVRGARARASLRPVGRHHRLVDGLLRSAVTPGGTARPAAAQGEGRPPDREAG